MSQFVMIYQIAQPAISVQNLKECVPEEVYVFRYHLYAHRTWNQYVDVMVKITQILVLLTRKVKMFCPEDIAIVMLLAW